MPGIGLGTSWRLVGAAVAVLAVAAAAAGPAGARGLAQAPRFTDQPTILDPVAGDAASVAADTVGDQPIALTCSWEDGGSGATPAWTVLAANATCSGFVLPASVDKHWLRALVTATNAAGGASEYTRAYLVGGVIVFHWNDGGLQELRAMYPDGSGQHEIGPSSTNWYYGEPAVSPDGSLIAFVSDKDPSSDGRLPGAGIFVMNSDGTDIRKVVYDASPDANPEWSPDGSQIVYESGGAIYTVNVDGTNERQVYVPGDVPYNDHFPSFSGNGSIVFSMRYEVTPGDPTQVWDAAEAGAPWDGRPWRFWQVARSPSKGTCSAADPDINYRLPPEFVDQTCYLVPIYQLYSVSASGGAPSELTVPQQFVNGETDPTHWTHVFADSLRATRASHHSGLLVTIGGSPQPGLGNPNALVWHPVVVGADGSWSSLTNTHADANASVAFSPDDTRILYDCDTPLACWGLHTVRLDGTGDFQIPNASITFGVMDWGILGTPKPAKPALTPLIFLPGIEGTSLRRGDDEVWPNALWAFADPTDGFLNQLSLTPEGTPLDGGSQLTIGDVVGHQGLPGPIGSKDVYNLTFDTLEQYGYKLDETLFPFPYDWRRSDEDNGRLLAGEIRAVLQQTGASSVDIIAHSQGGLVTLAMLHDDPSVAASIHRIVTLGTPVLGAPKAIGMMAFDEPCVAGEPIFGGCLYDPFTISQVMATLPSTYELMPSETYQAQMGSPLILGDSPMSYAGWTSFIGSLGYPTEMQDATSFHEWLDSYAPPVPLTRIFASQKPTISGWRVLEPPACTSGWAPCDSTPSIVFGYTFGDGTVPAVSAQDPVTPQTPTVDVGDVDHMGLATDPAVVDKAVAVLLSPTGTVAGTRASRAATASGFAGVDVQAGGHVQLLVDDGLGRLDGNDPSRPGMSYVEQIPGSSFDQAENSDSAFVTADGTYRATVTATGDGPVRLLFRPYASGAVTGQATFYLPWVKAGATMTLDYTESTQPDQLQLQLDTNGDGTVDETVAPYVTGAGGAADTTPPTTIGGANLSGRGVATVQLAAGDGAGSGVAATWYELPGDTAPRPYTGPFTAPLGTTVSFRSLDNAGNLEDVRSLVVDDVSDERAFAQPLTPPPALVRTLDTPADEDWFSFSADGTSTYEVTVTGGPGTTLALYGPDGTQVSAAPGGPSVKKLDVTPAAGTYYAEVAGDPSARTPTNYVIDLHAKK